MTKTNSFIMTLMELVRPRAVACLSLSPPYILIALLPIAVFLSLEIFVGIFAQAPNGLPSPSNEVPLQWMEEAARLQFLGLFILFVWFSVAVFIKFLSDLLFLFDRASQLWLVVAFLLSAFAGGVIILLALEGAVIHTYEYFGEEVFRNAIKSGTEHSDSGKLADWLQWYWNWESFQTILKVVNLAASMAVPAFIAGGISCLAIASGPDEKDLDTQKETWIAQRERLKNYVYLSAALLVVALVFMKSWTHYPSFMLKQGNDSVQLAAYNAVVNSVSVLTGIEYTLLLAAYAIPVSFFLSRQADQIAYGILSQRPGATIQDIRKSEKLIFSSQDSIKTIVALLLPVVTGSIETISSILKSAT